MKTAIYNGKLITPAEVLENKVLVLENDRIIDILAEDVIDLGQYDESKVVFRQLEPMKDGEEIAVVQTTSGEMRQIGRAHV